MKIHRAKTKPKEARRDVNVKHHRGTLQIEQTGFRCRVLEIRVSLASTFTILLHAWLRLGPRSSPFSTAFSRVHKSVPTLLGDHTPRILESPIHFPNFYRPARRLRFSPLLRHLYFFPPHCEYFRICRRKSIIAEDRSACARAAICARRRY